MVVKKLQDKVEINEQVPHVLVAAYGTLRKGEGNNHFMDGSEYMGTYQTDPQFTMLGKGAGFPVVATSGKTAITYDVFKVTDNNRLSRIHRLEGFTGRPGDASNWYDVIFLQTPHGTAIMYVMHDDGQYHYNQIESGDWKNQ